MNISQKEIEGFVEKISDLCAEHGPQRPRHLARYAGYGRSLRGAIVWSRACEQGLLIADGYDEWLTAYRPRLPQEPFEIIGNFYYTPAAAIAARAEEDQIQATMADGTFDVEI